MNPYIYLGIGAGLLLQLAAIYLIPGIFGVVPLALEHWFYVVAFSLAGFLIVEAIKWWEHLHGTMTVSG